MGMFRLLVAVAVMLVVTACGPAVVVDEPADPSAAVNDPSASPDGRSTLVENSATVPPAVTTLPPTSSTVEVADEFMWPGTDPDGYAVVYGDRVEVVDPDGITILDIAGVRSGAMVGDQFVYALQGFFGTWVWPERPGLEGPQPAGGEKVSMLIGQAGTEIHTWFHNVAVIDGRPTVIYSEIETEAEGQPERVMLYDLETAEIRQLFDRVSRRPGLSGEEQEAWIASASFGGDRFVVLLGFGDSTWLEWYDINGQPIDDPFDQSVFPGEVAEALLSPTGETLAVTIETGLHQPIRELLVIETSGDMVGDWRIEDPTASLYGLDTDGRYVTAGLMSEANPSGMIIVDLADSQANHLSTPARIAMDRTFFACRPIPPTTLPDGTPVGEARLQEGDYGPLAVWGESSQYPVHQGFGYTVFDASELGDGPTTTVRGNNAVIVPIGDGHVGQIAVVWAENSCVYTVWVGPGLTLDDAIAYAESY